MKKQDIKRQRKLEKISQEQKVWQTKIKCVVFDLDGTLVDTIEDISDSVNHALEQFDFPTHDYEFYKSILGYGVDNLIKNALGDNYSEENFKNVKDYYNRYYARFPCRKSRAYNGVINMLRYLTKVNYYIVVVTNKGQLLAEKICKTLFPEIKFDMIIGDDGFNKIKPNPSSMEYIKNTFTLTNEEILYVGDSEVDKMYCDNSHISKCYFFTHGFRNRKQLEEIGIKNFFDSPTDIIAYLHENGGYKENGRLSLAIISYIFVFALFSTDIGIAVNSQSLLIATIVCLAVGFIFTFSFFYPYATKKSYLNFNKYMLSMSYLLGTGSTLSAYIAYDFILGDELIYVNQDLHIFFTSLLSVIVFVLMIFFIVRYFLDRYNVKRREREF